MTAQLVHYEGRVQGVGFRATVKSLAAGFEVCGSVANLPDGRVELRVRGEEDEVDEFLREIRESQLGSCIREELAKPLEPQSITNRGIEISG